MSNRLARFRAKLSEQKLDMMLIAQPENRRYLSGYTATDDAPDSPNAWLIISQDKALLLTGFTNFEWAKSEAPDFEVVQLNKSYVASAADLMNGFAGSRLGFEASYLPVASHRSLSEALNQDKELVASEGLVEQLREVKEQQEIDTIRTACDIADEALTWVIDNLRIGQTEEELAWALEQYMREHGADGIAFDLIIASGANSALPHYRSAARAVRPGEPLLIDMGARVQGYNSDITRTYYIGDPDERFTEVYNVVLAAQQAAREAIKPGITGGEVDEIARQIISQAGYGDHFGHGLGHGVGLAVHEKPTLSKASQSVLVENEVVTVEPGIYLPGWGGVRIEDTVLITAAGTDILTKANKTIRVIPKQ